MDELDLLSVERFVLRCNELLGGRFLDLTQKLDLLMQDIIKSDAIMTYLADALDEYDADAGFSAAFPENATEKTKVKLPKDDKQRLALTVSIFNDIDNGKLNLTKFLETYFKDENATPMQNFLNLVIKPFRDAIAKYFDVDVRITEEDIAGHQKETKVEEEEEEPELPGLSELCEEIKKVCVSILSQLKFEKKKEVDDAEFVVNSIIRACELKDLTVINGLIVGLSYVAKKLKAIRHSVDELTTLVYGFYEGFGTEEEEQEEPNDEEETEE